MWKQLNQDIDPSDQTLGPCQRILARLGDYTALVVAPLSLRPTSMALQKACDRRIEVRISMATTHVVLVIAPEGDLAPEVFWLRSLAATHLPIPRLLAFDLDRTTVPFTYALESYTCGTTLDRLADGPLMKVAARQLGRTLRRAHQVAAPGFGRPTPTGRWPARDWRQVLREWLLRRDLLARAAQVLGSDLATAWQAATLDHPSLCCDQPRVIHGGVEPARAVVTVGDNIQLEALADPGDLVGGDPLFDLAYGLRSGHSAGFRQGLLEGYLVSGPLTPQQEAQLQRLSLLLAVVDLIENNDQAAQQDLPGEVIRLLHSFG